MNNNIAEGSGDLMTSFLLGRCSEYLHLGDLFGHIQSFKNGTSLLRQLEDKVENIDGWETKKFESIWQFRTFRILLFVIVRDIRPSLIVETGVLHGMTSAFILEALNMNDYGKLLSIDMPSYFESGPANQDGYDATLPSGLKPGWIVPDNLRERWNLQLGNSIKLLNTEFQDISDIDIFCHDSEHTYDTMWKELNFAWERLSATGILVCDNVEANSAFFDFCRKVNRLPLVLPAPTVNVSYIPRFAIISKRS